MEVILGGIIQGTIIMGISYLLGIAPQVLMVLATLSVLKLLSGGVHFSTFGRCTAFSASMAISIGYLATLIAPYMDKKAILQLVILTALTGLYFVSRWAPADNPSKPITGEEKRETYRKFSLLYVVFWAAAVALSAYIYGDKVLALSLITASVGGLLAQTISLHPLSFRLINTIEHMLDKLSMRGKN